MNGRAMVGRRDDPLVVRGGGILVGKHADAPGIAGTRHFRRRGILISGAEGTELAGLLEIVGALGAGRCEDQWFAADRVEADHGWRSRRSARARRWTIPNAANNVNTAASQSAMVNWAKRSPAQPFVKRM